MHEMRDFFYTLNSLYEKQIKGRLVTGPADVFLPRMQNVWGREFILTLLADYFTAWPPRSPRMNLNLRQLPDFLLSHPNYSQVLALYDMTVLCLRLHELLYGPDPEPSCIANMDLHNTGIVSHSFFHFPADPLHLDQLWRLSQKPLRSDPWSELLKNEGRGCIFVKTSADQCLLLPLPAALVPLLEGLTEGRSLHQALLDLDENQSTVLHELLPASISLWQQSGLLTGLASPHNLL